MTEAHLPQRKQATMTVVNEYFTFDDFVEDDDYMFEDVPDVDWEIMADFEEIDRINYETTVRFRSER